MLCAIAAIAFSGKAVIIKLAYRHGVDAVTLLALRMIFSAPLFVALGWWSSRRTPAEPLSRADLRAIIGLGLIGYYLSSYFDFVGLQYITAALERLVLFLYPTFVLLLSALFFRRRITARDVAAVVISYVGIGVVFMNDFRTQPGNVLVGSLWVLLSSLFYATYLMGSGRLVGRVGVVVHFLVVSDAHVILSQPAPVYGLALLMAAVSTVMPIVLTSEGIRRIGATNASIVGSTGPVATIFLGYIFLGEPITAVQLTGAALVLAGVLIVSLGKRPEAAGRRV